MKRHDNSVKKFAKKLKNLDFGNLKYDSMAKLHLLFESCIFVSLI